MQIQAPPASASRTDMPTRGSAAAMQNYNLRRRKLEVAISEAKC